MRILIGATRAVLSFFTTVHIAAIRAAAWAEARKIYVAQKATDAAGFANAAAHAAAIEAEVLYQDALRFEGRVATQVAGFRAGLQAEIDTLRRGVSL